MSTYSQKHKPVRSCNGCRRKEYKYNLLRIVLDAEHELILDQRQKCPGRGAYLCPDENCLNQALKRNAFQRAFKCKISSQAQRRFAQQFIAYLSEKNAIASSEIKATEIPGREKPPSA